MTPSPPGRRARSAITPARLRLWSGLVIFAFVVTHFANHIAGIFLVETMEAVRPVLMAIWHTPPAEILLYAALISHPMLTLSRVWHRRTWTLTQGEWWQLALGVALPFILLGHLVDVSFAGQLYGVQASYQSVLLTYMVDDPARGVLMALLVVVVWAHACLGLHYWLRLRSWYLAARPALAAAAIVFPALTLAGLIASGTDLARRTEQRPELAAAIRAEAGLTPAAGAELRRLEARALAVWLGLLALLVAWRAARDALARRRNPLEVTYAGGRTVVAPHGLTVLEVSRIAGLPHASVCSGRGRCSTCRVAVLSTSQPLPAPGPQERETLRKIRCGPEIRLACQLRPRGKITVRPIIPAREEGDRHPALAGLDRGQELDVAVLAVDMRSSSRLADHKLPYDVLYIVDRFLIAVLGAMRSEGGHVVSVAGDGAVAVFGLEGPVDAACRSAVAATLAVFAEVERINVELAEDLPFPLAFAAGLDADTAIVGLRTPDAGYPVQFVGSPGTVAARLEEFAKQEGAPVAMSRRVAELAGLALDDGAVAAIPLRGRSATVDACLFRDRAELAAAAGATLEPQPGALPSRA